MDEWVDVTVDIDVGEDERHLAGYFPDSQASKGFIWNAVPRGFRIRKVSHYYVNGDEIVNGAAFIVERLT